MGTFQAPPNPQDPRGQGIQALMDNMAKTRDQALSNPWFQGMASMIPQMAPRSPQTGHGQQQGGGLQTPPGTSQALKTLINGLGGGSEAAIAGLGGAASGLSGMGAGSLAGTVGGADILGSLAGGTGFLPSYGAAGGTMGSGIFGGGSAAASGAGSASGAGALGGAGAGTAAAAALPFAIAFLGMTGMFDSDVEETSELDNYIGMSRATPDQISRNPRYPMVGLSRSGANGGFVYDPSNGESYDQYLKRTIEQANYGNMKWDSAAEPYARQVYDNAVKEAQRLAAGGQLQGWDSYYDSISGGG